jgi:tRNA A37 threonylcarbamoyladenosine dehydratase
MGLPILRIYDDDNVDETNLPGQMHRLSDVGDCKAYALEEALAIYADDTEIVGLRERVVANYKLPRSNVIISAVDSINARKEIWASVVTNNTFGKWYIDARMAGEKSDIFIVDMMSNKSVMNYNIMLASVNEEDVEELPCTEKATFFCASAIAGQIGAIVRNILRDEQKSERIVYYMPQAVIHKFDI